MQRINKGTTEQRGKPKKAQEEPEQGSREGCLKPIPLSARHILAHLGSNFECAKASNFKGQHPTPNWLECNPNLKQVPFSQLANPVPACDHARLKFASSTCAKKQTAHTQCTL